MILPEEVKTLLWHNIIRAVKKIVKDQGWQGFADRIEEWTADPILKDSFFQAVKTGRDRFSNECKNLPMEICIRISQADDLFASAEVLGSLWVLINNPNNPNLRARNTLKQALRRDFLDSEEDAVLETIVTNLLTYIVADLLALPGTADLRELYSLVMQVSTAEKLERIIELTEHQNQHLRSITGYMLNPNQPASNLIGSGSLLRRRPYHNVPRPDYTRLVGRDDQLTRLRKLLHPDDRVFQIALVGIGGVGKSALAQAIAIEYIEKYESLDPKERFECIVWASAKEEVLTLKGREPASAAGTGIRTLEDVYSRLAFVLEKESINTAPPGKQDDIVKDALREQRCLLIIDNFESVTDPRIKPFLRELPAPAKAIITSREGFDVADSIRLHGLAQIDAAALAQDEANRYSIELTQAEQDRLWEVTDGFPLPIRLGIARYATGETFEAVTHWIGDADGDIPAYCIRGQVDLAMKQSPNNRSILLACSLFDMDYGASADALGYVASLNRHDRDKAIGVLLRLLLLQLEGKNRYRMLPITQRFARTQFVSPSEADSLLSERWLEWLLKTVAEVADDELDASDVDVLSVEYPNVLSAARWCFNTKRWRELYTLSEGVWSRAYTHSLFLDFDELLTMAMIAAQAMKQEDKIGRVELQRARLQLIQAGPDSEGLMDLLDSAIRRSTVSGHVRAFLVALYTKGFVLFRQGHIAEAEKVADELLERAAQSRDEQFAFWGHYRKSEVHSARHNFEEALTSLKKAESYALILRSARLHAHILHRRSSVLMAQGNGKDAIPILKEAIILDRRRGELRYVALDILNLAEVYAEIPDMKEQAVPLANEARSLYTRLGMHKEIERASKLLDLLAKMQNE